VTYVIAEPCIGEKNGACVDVCPAACIHTTPESPQNFIDPDVCIECEQCVLVCPVDAVFLDTDLPPEWQRYIEINAEFFTSNKVAAVFPDNEIERIFESIHRFARRANASVAIAIVAPNGDVIAVSGNEQSRQEAEHKAYTALSYGLGTHELKPTSKPLWQDASHIDANRVLMQPGGLPIIERGQTIGAVGVAGAGGQDLLCAQAAFSTVAHL
jgi:uncharacterized protein GlcG (DUF336 family)/NAD-dependent dihydropyrimidine dehydrogenase PreA subunit